MAFGDFLRGQFAQINPFDGGQTYQTVRDDAARKRREEEERRRREQEKAQRLRQQSLRQAAQQNAQRQQTAQPTIRTIDSFLPTKKPSFSPAQQKAQDASPIKFKGFKQETLVKPEPSLFRPGHQPINIRGFSFSPEKDKKTFLGFDVSGALDKLPFGSGTTQKLRADQTLQIGGPGGVRKEDVINKIRGFSDETKAAFVKQLTDLVIDPATGEAKKDLANNKEAAEALATLALLEESKVLSEIPKDLLGALSDAGSKFGSEAILNMATTLAREIGPRGAARVGKTFADNKLLALSNPFLAGFGAQVQDAQKSDNIHERELANLIFGSKPIESSEEDLRQIVQDTPLKNVPGAEKVANFGPAAAGFGILLNLPGLGSGDDAVKGLTKALKGADSTTDVAKLLSNANLDLSEDAIRAIADTKRSSKINKLISPALKQRTAELTRFTDDVARATNEEELFNLVKARNPEIADDIARDAARRLTTANDAKAVESVFNEVGKVVTSRAGAEGLVDFAKTSKSADEFTQRLIDNLKSSEVTDPDLKRALAKAENGDTSELKQLYEGITQKLSETAPPKIPVKALEAAEPEKVTGNIPEKQLEELAEPRAVSDTTEVTPSALATDDVENIARLPEGSQQQVIEETTRQADVEAREISEEVARQQEDLILTEAEIRKGVEDGVLDPSELDVLEGGKIGADASAVDVIDEAARLADLDVTPDKLELKIFNRMLDNVSSGKVQNLMQLNPFRKLSKEAGKTFNKLSQSSIESGGVRSIPLRGMRTVFAGTGVPDEIKVLSKVRVDTQANASLIAKQLQRKLDSFYAQSDNVDESVRRLNQFFREPDYLDRVYGNTRQLGLEELTEAERGVAETIVQLNKQRNDLLLRQGKISPDLHAKYADGRHTPRLYDFSKSKVGNQQSITDLNAIKKRKDITEFDDELIDMHIEDPIHSALARWEVATRDQATFDYLSRLDKSGLMRETPPNKNWVQLKGDQYGAYKNKWVDNTTKQNIDQSVVYSSEAGQAYGDIINLYKRSKLGKLDQAQKAFKTVYSPGTIMGNILSNPLMFNRGAGVGILRQSVGASGAAKRLAQEAAGKFDAGLFDARKFGVIGGDTGKQLIGNASTKNFKIIDKTSGFYGGIDDSFKVALWENLQKKGLSKAKAAEEVAKFTQDYNNVGRLVQTIADTPILGKPFARFGPELVRIVKNNLVNAPHGFVGGLAALAAWNNWADKENNPQKEGESDEDYAERLQLERESRENQVGQTKVPGTAWINRMVGGPDREISLNIPIPKDHAAAVNVARAVGLNFPQEPGSDPTQALLEQLLPVEVPTRKNAQGDTVFDPTKIVTSMTFRPIVEQVFNQNFMGREITDPEQRKYYESSEGDIEKFAGDPEKNQQWLNRFRHAGVALLPFGNELDSLFSASTGKPTITGKERSLPDAIMRAFGLKFESNDPEARKKRLELKNYFEGSVERTNEFLNKNPDLVQTYYKFNNPTKDRETGNKVSDLISPEKWALVRSEKDSRLFDFLASEAKKQNEESGRPIDPIFLLKPDQARAILDIRTRPTGDDVETKERLRATQEWYKKYEDDYDAYFDANDEYFKKLDLPDTRNSRIKEYGELKHPERDKLIDKYYKIKESDKDKAKQFFKDNSLEKVFDKYRKEKLEWTNKKREIEGFDPITEEEWNNVTFGYEEDEKAVLNRAFFKLKDQGKVTGFFKFTDDESGGGSGKGGGKGSGSSKIFLPGLTSKFKGGPRVSLPKVSVATKSVGAPGKLKLPFASKPSKSKKVKLKI